MDPRSLVKPIAVLGHLLLCCRTPSETAACHTVKPAMPNMAFVPRLWCHVPRKLLCPSCPSQYAPLIQTLLSRPNSHSLARLYFNPVYLAPPSHQKCSFPPPVSCARPSTSCYRYAHPRPRSSTSLLGLRHQSQSGYRSAGSTRPTPRTPGRLFGRSFCTSCRQRSGGPYQPERSLAEAGEAGTYHFGPLRKGMVLTFMVTIGTVEPLSTWEFLIPSSRLRFKRGAPTAGRSDSDLCVEDVFAWEKVSKGQLKQIADILPHGERPELV